MLAINYSQNNEEFTCQPFAPTLPCKNNTVLSRCATNSIIHPLLSMIMVLNLHIVIRLIKNCILSKKSDIYYYWYTNLLSLLVEQQGWRYCNELILQIAWVQTNICVQGNEVHNKYLSELIRELSRARWVN